VVVTGDMQQIEGGKEEELPFINIFDRRMMEHR
jgi:hypothetical protein